MSASQYAPEDFGVIDTGQASDILVDGLAHFAVSNGIVRAVYYTHQPLLGPGEDENASRYIKAVSVRLVYSLEAHRLMQRQRRSLGDTCKLLRSVPDLRLA